MKSIIDIIKDEFIKRNPDLERQYIQNVRISYQGNVIVEYFYDNSDWDNSFNKSKEFNLGKASEIGLVDLEEDKLREEYEELFTTCKCIRVCRCGQFNADATSYKVFDWFLTKLKNSMKEENE